MTRIICSKVRSSSIFGAKDITLDKKNDGTYAVGALSLDSVEFTVVKET